MTIPDLPFPDPAATPQNASVALEEADLPGTSERLSSGKTYRRYVFWFALVLLAMAAIVGSASTILLPNHVQMLTFAQFFTGANASVNLQQLQTLKDSIAAGTAVATPAQAEQLRILAQFDAARAQALALVTTLGVLGSTIATPIVGVLSDRTRSKRGRRAPWILFGGIAGALFLASMTLAPSVAIVALLWTITQVMLSCVNGPIATTMADRVVETRRGTVSALSGLGTFLGGILGVIGVGIGLSIIGLNVYIVLAVIVVICATGFVLIAKDRSSKDLVVPAISAKSFLSGFLVPLRDRDFRWVWTARLLLTFGYATSGALAFYVLQSYIKPALSAAQATALVPILSVLVIPFTLIALVVAGRLSDRLKRRKVFVLGSSVLMAIGLLVPLVSPTIPGLIVSGILVGIAYGAYLTVDQALFVDVLPDRTTAGRDLGIAYLGGNIGTALGPVLAAAVLGVTGSYGPIYLVAAVLVLVAAFAILPVKRVR